MDNKPKYDDIPCPKPGAFTNCEPECFSFEHGKAAYRVVLIGKYCKCDDVESPEYVLERRNGRDALGVWRWKDSEANAMLFSLVHSMRGDRS